MIGKDGFKYVTLSALLETPAPTNKPEFKPEVLDAFHSAYTSGQHIALFDAATYCGKSGQPLPEWVTQGLSDGISSYKNAAAQSLGDAFNLPDNKRVKEQADWRLYGLPVWMAVHERHQSGQPIDEAIFEAVAADFDLPKNRVSKYYYSYKKWIKESLLNADKGETEILSFPDKI